VISPDRRRQAVKQVIAALDVSERRACRALQQPKRGRLWLNDGSVIRLRPEFPKHVWSYDFMQDHTHNGVP